MDVVTSLRADEMTGALPTSKGVQGAAGSVRTYNDRELEVQFGQMFPIQDAESSAVPASETAVGQKSGESDNEDLPSSASGEETTPSTPALAPASITQENGGNNGIEKAIAEEP